MNTYTVELHGITWDTEVDGVYYDAAEEGLPVWTRINVDADTIEEAVKAAENETTERFGYCIAGYDNYYVEEERE